MSTQRKGIFNTPKGLAVAGAILAIVSGCATTPATNGASANKQEPIKADEGVLAELTLASNTSVYNGARYNTHEFCASDNTAAVFTLQAPFDARAALFNDNDELVDFADSQLTNEQPTQIVLNPADGSCATLAIVGNEASSYGPYRILPKKSSTDSSDWDLKTTLITDADGDNRIAFDVENPSMLNFSLLDGTRTSSFVLTGDGVEFRAERCSEEQAILSTFLEPGSYQIEFLPTGNFVANPELPVSCPGALVDEGYYYVLSAASQQLPPGIKNGGALSDGEVLTGQLFSASNQYQLNITEPSRVVIDLTSRDFDSLLTLEGNGEYLENDDYLDSNSRIDSVLLAGQYKVIVNVYGWDTPSAGEYQLATEISPMGQSVKNSGEIIDGESIFGVLEGNSNTYTFELTETVEIVFDVTTASFDTVLTLTGEGIEIQNDDSADSTRSFINSVLPAGQYQIEMTTLNTSGTYTMEFSTRELDGRFQNSGALKLNDYVLGNLESYSELTYELTLDETTAITILAASSSIDTFLTVSGSGDGRVYTDDDSGGGTDAQIIENLEAGTYFVTVTAYDESSSGIVRLEVTAW